MAGIEYFVIQEKKSCMNSLLACCKNYFFETYLFTPPEEEMTHLLLTLINFHKKNLIVLKLGGPSEESLVNHERSINLHRIALIYM
jgi:hypothetical protein